MRLSFRRGHATLMGGSSGISTTGGVAPAFRVHGYPVMRRRTPRGLPRTLRCSGVYMFLKSCESGGANCDHSRVLYRATSLITCGDFENACLFLKRIRMVFKNGCLFLQKIRNFSKNGCLFFCFRPLPLCDVVSDQKRINIKEKNEK